MLLCCHDVCGMPSKSAFYIMPFMSVHRQYPTNSMNCLLATNSRHFTSMGLQYVKNKMPLNSPMHALTNTFCRQIAKNCLRIFENSNREKTTKRAESSGRNLSQYFCQGNALTRLKRGSFPSALVYSGGIFQFFLASTIPFVCARHQKSNDCDVNSRIFPLIPESKKRKERKCIPPLRMHSSVYNRFFEDLMTWQRT